jgi:hypothetical protein
MPLYSYFKAKKSALLWIWWYFAYLNISIWKKRTGCSMQGILCSTKVWMAFMTLPEISSLRMYLYFMQNKTKTWLLDNSRNLKGDQLKWQLRVMSEELGLNCTKYHGFFTQKVHWSSPCDLWFFLSEITYPRAKLLSSFQSTMRQMNRVLA